MDTIFAPHAERADFADALVNILEKIQHELWGIRTALETQRNQDKCRLTMVANPALIGLDNAAAELDKSRRLLVIEAYDERRRAELDKEPSDG